MCCERINISVMYIVELLINIFLTKLVWSVLLNFFIVLGSPRRRFHDMGEMI